jgi:catechol 2,3-dioxygenase-like lactoylglutathione lyase family enzyme
MEISADKPRMVGINHVALEVGDVEAALEFYGRIFEFTLRGKGDGQAFIDLGDQFIALMQSAAPQHGMRRHFGIVVDDRARVRELAAAAGAEIIAGPFLDFLDPWGNRIEVVEYANVQFSKTPEVLHGMRLELAKNSRAIAELEAKGMAPKSP